MFFASNKSNMLNALVLIVWVSLLAVLFVVDIGSAVTFRHYNETCECGDDCQENTWCRRDLTGGLSCLCLPGQYFDADLNMCVDRTDCVDGSDPNACRSRRLPNGDYAGCTPVIQHGSYLTCSNGYLYLRDCALGWVITSEGTIVTQKMVFDPDTKTCGNALGLQCKRVPKSPTHTMDRGGPGKK